MDADGYNGELHLGSVHQIVIILVATQTWLRIIVKDTNATHLPRRQPTNVTRVRHRISSAECVYLSVFTKAGPGPVVF